MQTGHVYKIISEKDWSDACAIGCYNGSSDDKRDGFIHLSAAAQVRGTLEKHFFQKQGLVLVRFRTKDLAPHLTWERSRGGELFPHLYGSLPARYALKVIPLRLDKNGNHELPELIG